MQRKIIGVTLREMNRAEWVREQTAVKDILVEIKLNKYTCASNYRKYISASVFPLAKNRMRAVPFPSNKNAVLFHLLNKHLVHILNVNRH